MATKDGSSLPTALASYYADLVRYLTKRLGNQASAKDVAQDTFLRLQKVPADTEIQSPRAYLFRMADNLAIDRLRHDATRARYYAEGDGDADGASTAPSPEAVLDYRQRLKRLEQAIDELPPKCREVFLLHKFDELSHAEIARKLGLSKSMVEKHIMKALAHCRDRLGDLLD